MHYLMPNLPQTNSPQTKTQPPPSYMHYLMPKRGILSLHSGCNIGHEGDTTLFFGLSGEGLSPVLPRSVARALRLSLGWARLIQKVGWKSPLAFAACWGSRTWTQLLQRS